MATWSEDEIERTLEEIKKRSITDPEFRELALSDPNKAISKVNPKPVPEVYKVKFLDNSGPVKSFLLPDPVSNVEDLSDAELEAVAGGIGTRTNTSNSTNIA